MVIRRFSIGLVFIISVMSVSLQGITGACSQISTHAGCKTAKCTVLKIEADYISALKHSSSRARWFVHDALQNNNTLDSIISVIQTCDDVDTLCDLIIEASMADRLDIVKPLIDRAYRIENGALSDATYRSLVMGYKAAYFRTKYEKLPENQTAAFFRSQFKDVKFVEANNKFR